MDPGFSEILANLSAIVALLGLLLVALVDFFQ